MITKLNDNTSVDVMKKYRKLFDSAFNDLKTEGLLTKDELDKGGFSDLSEYFAHMEHFLHMGKFKYLLLPLDERHFEINANTRIINVPPEFKSCSGVVSDNMAETITFLVDRYFDFVDLSSLSIDVQWVAPMLDGSKKFGVDEIGADMVDLDTFSEEGKLRFGWPLSKEITKNAGSIEFSVRFYYQDDANNGVVSYVLNTLPTTIPIRDGLNIDKNADGVKRISNHSNLYKDFIRNYNGPAAGTPTVVSFSITDLAPDYPYAINTANDTLDLKVCAHTADQRVLDYSWYKAINPETNDGQDREEITSGDVFTISTIQEAVTLTESEKASRPFKKYFYKPDLAIEHYEKYDEDMTWPPEVQLYQLHSCLHFNARPTGDDVDESDLEPYNNITGKYFATAKNSNGQNFTIGESSKASIWGPAKINYLETKKLPERAYLESGKDLDLKVEINHDDHNPEITHSWYFRDDLAGEKVVVTEGVLRGESDKTEETGYRVTTPGYYSVTTKSELNRGIENVESGHECAVYYPPEEPNFDDCVYAVKSALPEENRWDMLEDGDITLNTWIKPEADPEPVTIAVDQREFVGLAVKVSEFDAFKSGDISYKWFMQEVDKDPVEITDVFVGEGQLIPTGYPTNDSQLTIQWTYQGPDIYRVISFYCEVTNTIFAGTEDERSETKTTQSVVIM